MKATVSVVHTMVVTINGVNLGRFTQDGAVWNGLRCLANADGEKIIIQSGEPFSELIALLTSTGSTSDAEVLTISPNLLSKIHQKQTVSQ